MQPHAETAACPLCQRAEGVTTASWCMDLDHLGGTRHASESQQIIIVLDVDGILIPITPRLQDACRSETIRAVPTSAAYIYPVAIVSDRDLQNVWEANTPLGHNVTPRTHALAATEVAQPSPAALGVHGKGQKKS